MVKNPRAMQETWAQTLGREDPLEEGMGTPVFSPREFCEQRSLGGYSSMGSQRVRHIWATNTFDYFFIFILQIFKLKCRRKFVVNKRSQQMEPKELGFESWLYPNHFSSLPLSESFTKSFVFEAETAAEIPDFLLLAGRGQREVVSASNSELFKGHPYLWHELFLNTLSIFSHITPWFHKSKALSRDNESWNPSSILTSITFYTR